MTPYTLPSWAKQTGVKIDPGTSHWWNHPDVQPESMTGTSDTGRNANGYGFHTALDRFSAGVQPPSPEEGGQYDESIRNAQRAYSPANMQYAEMRDWLASSGQSIMEASNPADPLEYTRWLQDASGNATVAPESGRYANNNALMLAVIAGLGGVAAPALMGGGVGATAGATGGATAATTAGTMTAEQVAMLAANGLTDAQIAAMATAAGDTAMASSLTGAGMGGLAGTAGAETAAAAAAKTTAGDTALKTGTSSVVDALLKNPSQTLAAGTALVGALNTPEAAPVLDANAAAAAQAAANKDTALFNANLNRPDQVTPYGSSKWSLRPGADPKNPQPGDWVQTTALSEGQQQIFNADQQLQLGLSGAGQAALGRVNSTLDAPLDMGGLPSRGSVSNFTGTDRQRIEDALLERMAPQFAQQEEATRSRVLNTGFELGSEGANREFTRLDQAKNDARLAAIAQSGQEAERLGNISRADASFQNQSRQQALSELLTQRALPLNELNSIRSGTQVQMPTFSPVSQQQTASTPVLEALMAQLNGEQASAANSQSGYNALLQSLAGLGGAWLNTTKGP